MYFLSKRNNPNKLIWIISLSIFLRSFIAPGYMISASAENGLKLILCDGPVSLNVQQDQHSDHNAHNDHSAHNEHSNDDASNEIHISPICSQWSTSSLLVINTLFEPANVIAIHHNQQTQYQTRLFQQVFNNNHDIRGPPSLS